MSYPREAKLEKYIKDFMLCRRAEKVDIHLKKQDVYIKCLDRGGSILAATLWVNILQHPLNFPSNKFPYRKQRALHERETSVQGDVALQAEGLSFIVYMKTGTLRIHGDHAIPWVEDNLRGLIANYDPVFDNDWSYIPTPTGGNACSAEACLRDYNAPTEDYMLCRTHKLSNRSDDEEDLDYLVPGVGGSRIIKSVWTDEELNAKLAEINEGSVKSGTRFLYKLWRSLLNYWFGAEGAKIYLASPSIDEERLTDIAYLLLENLPKANLQAIYTSTASDDVSKKTTAAAKRGAISKFPRHKHPEIEYLVFNKMKFPMQRFSVKFIARVMNGVAKVLITSANFHGDHFDCDSMESVAMQTMTESEFMSRYIDPITLYVVDTDIH